MSRLTRTTRRGLAIGLAAALGAAGLGAPGIAGAEGATDAEAYERVVGMAAHLIEAA